LKAIKTNPEVLGYYRGEKWKLLLSDCEYDAAVLVATRVNPQYLRYARPECLVEAAMVAANHGTKQALGEILRAIPDLLPLAMKAMATELERRTSSEDPLP